MVKIKCDYAKKECEDFMHEIIYPNKEGGQR